LTTPTPTTPGAASDETGRHAAQAVQEYDGVILRRWYVFTDKGRKVVWAPTKQRAKGKVERRGFQVSAVEPAPSPVG
jgi:hypothetical protein